MKKLVSLVLVLALSLSLSVPALAATLKAGDKLTGNEKFLYDYCVNKIDGLFEGKITSSVTEYTIPFSDFPEYDSSKSDITDKCKIDFTSNDLGFNVYKNKSLNTNEEEKLKEKVSSICPVKVNCEAVTYALRSDFPQKTYWISNCWARVEFYYWSNSGFITIAPTKELTSPDKFDKLTVTLYVTKDYRKNNTKIEIKNVAELPEAMNTSKNNTDSVVDKVKNLSTYEKVAAFYEYICKAVSYDQDYCDKLTSNPDYYGNPSQITNVFDDSQKTNVVCEGYAKAFKYLCDRAEIPCYYVEGNMGAELHAWNIVQMDDGELYHVDVTNCDMDYARLGNGSLFRWSDVGVWNWDRFFLKAVSDKSDQSYTSSYGEYIFSDKYNSLPGGSEYYKIDDHVFKVWGSQLISQLSTTDYVPAKITFNTDGHGTAPDAKIVNYHTAVGELPAPTANGFTFEGWYNGTTEYTADSIIDGPIELTAKWTATTPTTHSVAVNPTANGTATVSKVTATAGEEITVTATPASGYELDSITVTPDTAVANGKFTMPASDVTITVTFKATQAPQPAALTGTVTISGTPKVGETLTATVTGANNSGTLSYQWKAGDANVGTNKTTYQPTASDVGKPITCVVTSSVETGSIVSTPTAAVAAATAPQPTTYRIMVNPATNGTAKVSKTTATAGEEIIVTAMPASGYELDRITVTPSTTVTNGKFTMPASDVTVTVTFKATSTPTPQPATLTGMVTVSGTPKVGETLTATVTGANNSGTLSYQWKAGGTVVGTNKTTYQPTAADIGKTITCVVTSSVETGSIVSTPTAAVAAADTPTPVATKYTVSFVNVLGAAPASQTVEKGGYAVKPADPAATGYSFGGWLKPDGSVFDFATEPITADIVLTAKWVAATTTYRITVNPTTNGTAKVSSSTAAAGDTVTVTATPANGYELDSITVTPSTTVANGKFVMPASDVTVTVTFKAVSSTPTAFITLNHLGMNLEVGDYGTLFAAVTPSGSVTWSSSDTRVVTVDSNGSYFATGAGSATISVTANGKTATCYVTVTDPTFSANYTPYIPSGTQTTQSGTQTGTRTPGVGSETTNTTATPTTDVFTTVVDNPDGTRFTVVDNRNGISSIVQKDSYGQLLFESVTYSAAALARSNSVITAPETVIPAYTEAGATEIQFTMPQSSGKQTVRIPVENATDTTVAVAMNMVGPSEPILDSHIEGNYLVFTTNGSATVKVIEGAKYFDDVSSANWFNSAVAWVSSHGVMVGTKANLFSPYANITRAQMAQLLYNLSGTSSESVTSRFSDVGGHWYDKSVSWAASNGLVSPQSQGYFGATADATRADMVTALYRYAKANGVNTSARADLSKFSDAATLTGEARDAMSWAVGIGLVNGSTQNNSRTVVLDPQGTVTRAQMATLMMRYCGMFA